MHTLLLVRNGVSHDARVLRAARVVEQTLDGGTLVVGVATASAPAGETMIEGVRVTRLPARKRASMRGSAHARGETPAHAPGTSSSARAAGGTSPSHAPSETPAVGVPGGPAHPLTLPARARRIHSAARFAWQALMVARRERPTLVHANDWNTMWCGVAIKLTCGARLVYDSHELWADRNGRWERRWWLLASEALFVRVADEVITASPGYADALARRYRIGRPTVVRNIPDGSWASTSVPQNPPLAVYVGGLMPGRGLEQTIDALALAPAMRMRAIGPGSEQYRASLIERATAAGVADRIELQPPVSPAQLSTALAQATVGLCLIQPVCTSYELTLPNKLFEYAAAGVPVLASDMPTMAALVRKNGLGEVVPADDTRAIAAALERLAQPDRRGEAAQRALAFVQANNWASESVALAEVYRRAAAKRRPARTKVTVATQAARTR